ncbi:hypothetical protein SAY87_027704 [Trapa incisa]|uniref:Uncharacterized protein n=1 Tax=Trapa incisa TaxID=236973 RepID=A0AAN7JMW8_9MYRT|nr:hypothetical protein SAY87_027704 [Trapa incisa]
MQKCCLPLIGGRKNSGSFPACIEVVYGRRSPSEGLLVVSCMPHNIHTQLNLFNKLKRTCILCSSLIQVDRL